MFTEFLFLNGGFKEEIFDPYVCLSVRRYLSHAFCL
ncbi:hypothetical protein S101395_01951 [Bacillus sonorensis]|uniref:Uncharacterized protein n=1 Tax=Bacillus sonorensis TaxID=119858 RepID=A0ABN5AHC1_9BACI|nr:hypothetical protein S101395_01951 [Bacillus sonorensis]